VETKANGADLYVVRTKIVNGLICLAESRPCKFCLDMCKMFGIKRIYYSTSDGNIIMEKTNVMISTHISYCYNEQIKLSNI